MGAAEICADMGRTRLILPFEWPLEAERMLPGICLKLDLDRRCNLSFLSYKVLIRFARLTLKLLRFEFEANFVDSKV